MKFTLNQYPEYRELVKQMSVRDLLKAVSCPQAIAEEQALEKGYQMVFLHKTTRVAAEAFIEQYNRGAAVPAIFCSDTECGTGDMLRECIKFPSMRALGECGSPELAYQAGRVTAQQSVEAGFRWSISPCVDILLREDAPAISTRAAGCDAQTVIDIAGGYMRGLQDGGVVATIKHFPGDGICAYDQHLTTAVNPLSKEQWWDTFGKVYRTLIDQGAMCIMPGHISLPAFDQPDPELGLCPPATLSYPLLTTLLREELGFAGIICSDAMTMAGFAGFMNYYEACATYLKCGGDIMEFVRTDEVFFEKMTGLVDSGFLPLSVLQDRAYRTMCFTRQVRESFRPQPELSIDAYALVQQITAGSVRIVRDRKKVLPFQAKADSRILVVDFSNVYTGNTHSDDFYQALCKAGYQADFWHDPGPVRLEEAAERREYDLIVCSVANEFCCGTNGLSLHGLLARNMMGGWSKLGTPVVFLCFGHPYFHHQFDAFVDTLINTYGVSTYTHTQVLKLLFGEQT